MEILNIIKKKKKTIKDYLKILLFGFFTILFIYYVFQITPIDN